MTTIWKRASTDPGGLSLKEAALSYTTGVTGLGGSTNFVVSYVLPKTVDAEYVTTDAALIDLPRPRFWHQERNHSSRDLNCNAIVRVSLDSSGTVSRVEKVPGYASVCPYVGDIEDAAKGIGFYPALRDGVPVSQRISVLYRTH